MLILEICPTFNKTSEQNSFFYHISLIAIVHYDYIKPKSPEGHCSLFFRDLILAYGQLELDIADVLWNYFVPRASKWLSPVNVALTVYAEIPPYGVEPVILFRILS